MILSLIFQNSSNHSRWLKYEEKVEMGGRWSKPHVSTASLHALLDLRRAVKNEKCIVDLNVPCKSPSLTDFAGYYFLCFVCPAFVLANFASNFLSWNCWVWIVKFELLGLNCWLLELLSNKSTEGISFKTFQQLNSWRLKWSTSYDMDASWMSCKYFHSDYFVKAIICFDYVLMPVNVPNDDPSTIILFINMINNYEILMFICKRFRFVTVVNFLLFYYYLIKYCTDSKIITTIKYFWKYTAISSFVRRRKFWESLM